MPLAATYRRNEMASKCNICGKHINKNQDTEVFFYKGVGEIVHSVCAKGREKAKAVVNNRSHHHCAPKRAA